jgi:ornithine carbamoyltransferase
VKSKSLLSISDLSASELHSLITAAAKNKGKWNNLLEKKIVAILFEKPSLRTRISFEVAARQLGAEAVYLSPAEVGLGQRESVEDVARVLGHYADIIAARTFAHRTVELLAEYSGVPVINALSDLEHPCQALADLLTIYEKKGGLKGATLAYIGDGNNVANSLVLASALAGMNFRIASPAGYEIRDSIKKTAAGYAAASGADIFYTDKPDKAAAGADVVYTDVWTSMGQEEETEKRRKAFKGYCVDARLMSLAKKDAIFMHDLPAHRGEEIAGEVIDSPQSVVFDQAENRMHAQKALMAEMLGNKRN